ncbi:MAG: hypothetical protein HXS54_15065 [Theionarchaea archaeon]|nr:hypothetical protein [Theionarchaea archaeon]
MENRRIKLFYRLPAISYKTYLEENTEYYDGIVVNANILALRKKSVTNFLTKIQKSYIIDPVTYKFNLEKYELLKDGKIQKSIEELSKEYGQTIKDKISQSEPLNYNDFQRNSNLIDEIARNVLAFQRSIEGKPSPGQKYRQMLGEDEGENIQPPIFLVTPYFFVSNQNNDWYDITRKLALASLKYKENLDLYATILAPKDVLYDTSFLDSIISDYRSFDGYLIWIDDFWEYDERFKSNYELIRYRNFIETLATQTGKPVYVMYGGYFSALMGKYGLEGFFSGPRYGESKKYNYATEEIGKVRYYLSLFKKRIPEDDASRFLQLYPAEICNCDFCVKEIARIRQEFPNLSDRDLVRKFFQDMEPGFKVSHFMASRYAEATDIQTHTTSELKLMLKNDIQKISSLKPQLVKEGNHIDKWEKTLTS